MPVTDKKPTPDKFITLTLPPSELQTCSYMDSFGESQRETVAGTIVTLAQRHGGWFKFTWEDFKNLVDHTATSGEHGRLDWFVEENYFTKEDDHYVPTNAFVWAIARQYRATPGQ